MKRNLNILMLTLLLAFASCSFTTKTFENSDKDKLLIQLITYVLEQGHFEPKEMNDTFSEGVYTDYLLQLDPYKRYFIESDIKEFDKYKLEIDDQLMDYDILFFNITHERLIKRIEESKLIYADVLENPFDFSKSEDYNTDYENLTYVKNKKQLKERWRKQLKFSSIANYHDLKVEQESKLVASRLMNKEQAEKALNPENEGKLVIKTEIELEEEAREVTLNSLNELYDFIDDRQRKDWFSVYINAIVE